MSYRTGQHYTMPCHTVPDSIIPCSVVPYRAVLYRAVSYRTGQYYTVSLSSGLREASDAVEREGILRARRSADSADLRLLVVDARRVLSWLDGAAPTPADTADDGRSVAAFVADQLRSLSLSVPAGPSAADPETLLVVNKADLVPTEAVRRLADWTAGQAASPVSCRTGAGLTQMADSLGQCLRRLCADAAAAAPALTRERHRLHVSAAERHVRRFVEQLEAEGDLALAAEELRLAARRLGEVTGHVAAEEILDVIFSDFCIGK